MSSLQPDVDRTAVTAFDLRMRLRLLLALLAAAVVLSAIGSLLVLWLPQQSRNPLAVDGQAVGYFFGLHLAGGAAASLIAAGLARHSSPFRAALFANMLPGAVGFGVLAFFGNLGILVLWVALMATAGTLLFWLILRRLARTPGR